VSVGGVLVDESPVVICMHCAQAAFPKRNAYKIQGIQRPATPFQIAENSSDHDYGELYQLLLQISCFSEGVLSQDLLAMQHKRQGLIQDYLHFLVDNARLVEWVGDSHVGYVYCLVENVPHLLTFEQFYHALYCKQACDSGDADVPEEAKESDGDEAESGNGSESDKAGDQLRWGVSLRPRPQESARPLSRSGRPRVARMAPSAQRSPQASPLQRSR